MSVENWRPGQWPERRVFDDRPRVTILIVEDYPDLLAAYADLFSEHGFQIIAAADGRRALQYLFSGALPDLVLLDLSLPRLDGRDVLSTIRTTPALCALPVVVVSGSNEEVRDADLQLEKPPSLDALLEAALLLLRRRRPTPTVCVG